MADSNLLKRGEPRHFDDNDPFAELTRIMGRDANPAGEASAAEAEDDFGIDLEREMLGDLDAPFDDETLKTEVGPEEAAAPVLEHSADLNPAPMESPVETAAAEYEELSAEALDDPDATEFDAPERLDDKTEPTQTGIPQYEAEASPWQPEPVVETTGLASTSGGGGDELGLADVDMDFGDLDFSEDDEASDPEELASAVPASYEPAATAHASEHGAPEWEPAIDEEPSLEDELGMLLSGDSEQPADPAPGSVAVEDWRYEQEPASSHAEVLPHISLGRANYAPVDENLESTAEDVEAGDRWSDEPTWDEPTDARWEPEQESDPLPEIQPDPFAVFSTIAPAATPAQPSVDAGPVDLSFDAVEEMETLEIPESAVPLQDDLDLPEPDLGDEPPAAFDDYDAEFAQVFGDMGDNVGAAATTMADVERRAAQEADDDLFAEAVGFGIGANGTSGAEYPTPTWHQSGASQGHSSADVIEREIDVATYGSATTAPANPRRKGIFIAAAVLAVAVLGGLGAFALSFGGNGSDDAPALVQADGEPLKVKPENPGGSTVPNQDSQAYEQVAGNAGGEAAAPQERLVTTTEEPVNLAARVQAGGVQENALPGIDEDLAALGETDAEMAGKSEERIEAPQQGAAGVGASEDLAAVQPRRVRTMIVRPDGTLVPREPEPSAPAASALGPIASQPQENLLRPVGEAQAPSTAAAATIAEPAASVIREVSTQAQTVPVPVETAPAAATATAAPDTTPASGPIVPERPVENRPAQPPAQQQQVAQAAAPVRTQPAVPQPQAAAGEWSMQIASQPTADGAQATYQDLARRYGNIIGGHGVNIVRADIPGKGTYYRVRIPSNTRAEAISLCEKYKAAGGSCFVSK